MQWDTLLFGYIVGFIASFFPGSCYPRKSESILGAISDPARTNGSGFSVSIQIVYIKPLWSTLIKKNKLDLWCFTIFQKVFVNYAIICSEFQYYDFIVLLFQLDSRVVYNNLST
jgi:hypothetical protein